MGIMNIVYLSPHKLSTFLHIGIPKKYNFYYIYVQIVYYIVNKSFHLFFISERDKYLIFFQQIKSIGVYN